MPPRKKREPSVLLHESCTLGWVLVEERLRCAQAFADKVDEGYIWIQEALVEIKKTLSTPEIKLIPKTPSKKRRKGRQRKVDSTGGRSSRGTDSLASQELNSTVTDTDSQEDSARPTRSTRSTRATSKPTGKSTRSRKAKALAEEETTGPEPVLSSSKFIESKEDTKTVSFKTDRKSSEDKSVAITEQKRVGSKEREILSPSDSVESTESSGAEKSPKKKTHKLSKRSSKNNTPTNKVKTPTTDSAKSPISAIKTAIRARTPVNQIIRHSPRSQSPSPRTNLAEKSPRRSKTIPNFSILNVKQKASAYEEHVHKVYHDSTCSSTSDDASSPQKRTRYSRSPRKDTENSDANPVTTQTKTEQMDTVDDASSNTLTVPKNDSSLSSRRSSTNRRSTRRSSARVSGVRSGVRMSLSRKRSSIMRHKLRTSQQAMSKQAKEQLNESLKSSPEKQDAGQLRSTRSKLRLHKVQQPPTLATPTAEPEVSSSGGEQAEQQGGGESAPRRTRSKARQTEPRTQPSAMDVDEVDGCQAPADPITPTLPTPPSSGEKLQHHTPPAPRNTRSSLRQAEHAHDSPSNRVSMSVKRAKPMTDESDEQTPPKRHCLDSEGEDDDVIEGTPQKQAGPRIVKPVRGGGLHDSAQKRPQNLNCSAVKSFIQRNTPQKKTMKEVEEERRRQFESKNKEAERRLARREEQQQRRRVELRKQREERQKRVENRRKEQQRSDQELKLSLATKAGSGGKPTGKKLIEDRIREEKEKRDKKMAEAEQRRKQVEELRLQKLKEQEEEKRRVEEQLARKRQEEERERMRKAAEQHRQEEERRLAQERERERELARKRAQEEETRRRAEAERKEREEREKRERAERDRVELQRQQERERQRREEHERQKEQEMKRLREERAREQERLREERETANMIKKHNHALQQNSSLNSQPSKPAQQYQQAMPKPKLNTSYTVTAGGAGHERHDSQGSTDSYDMTPVRKKPLKKATADDYGIDELKSDDSTDEEDQPKKNIPNWAVGAQLKASLIHQYYQPPDLDCIFDTVVPPDLNVMFIKKRPRFNKRTSSAVWDSPILKPSGAMPT